MKKTSRKSWIRWVETWWRHFNIAITSWIDVRLFIFYLSSGLARVCEIELSHMGKNNGNPDLVCENKHMHIVKLLMFMQSYPVELYFESEPSSTIMCVHCIQQGSKETARITVHFRKFRTLFSFYSQIICCLSRLEFTMKKQSDLGLHCLSRSFIVDN